MILPSYTPAPKDTPAIGPAYKPTDDTWKVLLSSEITETIKGIFIKDGDGEMTSPRPEFERVSHPYDKLARLPEYVKYVIVHTGPKGMVRAVAALGFMNVQRFHLEDEKNAHYINIDFMACTSAEGLCEAMIDEITKLGTSFGCRSVYTAAPLRFKVWTEKTEDGTDYTFAGGVFTYCALGFRCSNKMPVLDMKTCSVGMARHIDYK